MGLAAIIGLIVELGGPLAEKLIPVIIDGIKGVKNPDLDRPLRDFLSDVDFQGRLTEIRRKLQAMEVGVAGLDPGVKEG
ncbi:MAG: hypothetical protein Q7T26_10635 [Dehalococcoidia bacterium]|nr:hypothetical protein [Dehalococcoidia bacterium]